MRELQNEVHRAQPGSSDSHPAKTKRRSWSWLILFVTVALLGGVLFDWTRPPREQLSVVLYEKVVIGGYRTLLQPLSDRFIRCRFQPTCSVYSEEAMRTHGFPKGLWLTSSRLFRCMPWTPAGTQDPVPPAHTLTFTDTSLVTRKSQGPNSKSQVFSKVQH